MKKQLKESWLSYYVATPLANMVDSIKEGLAILSIKLRGGWYCEYCHKIHGRRVYKYKLLFTSKSCAAECKGSLSDISNEYGRYVCSLGKDAIVEEGWKPDYITLGDKLQSAISAIGDAFKGGM
jgi:hypothetical protein